MSTDGVTFDAKFAKFDAYKKYLQQNAKVLGIENKPLFEQLNRRSEDLGFVRYAEGEKAYVPTLTGMAEQKLPKTARGFKGLLSKLKKFAKTPGGKADLIVYGGGGLTILGGLVALGAMIVYGVKEGLFGNKNNDDVLQETASTENNITPVVPSDSTATAPSDTVPVVQDDSVQVAPKDSTEAAPKDSVAVAPKDSTEAAPKDSTVAVPPQQEDKETVEEKTAEEAAPAAEEEATEKAAAEDAKVAADESKETVEKVAVDETEKSEEVAKDETDEVVDEEVPTEENSEVKEEQENEGTQKPMGLSKGDGLTVAQLKGEIHENIVQNRYLRRELRLNRRYERRIGAPNEARPSDEEMREQINANKNETKLYRQQIRDIRRVERQERKLERQAHRDIRRIEYKAKQDERKLLNAAAQARKSGLEINETKLENDVENIKVTAKTQTDDIYAQTEQTIEQGRLSLKA